ncbi:hypothetical protein, conserved [Eimeria brunetti]|uniref:Uncharacterized protein n=1 Tax=Eimeria brunetti TaxID=51314 RepID=U6LKR7_9EIME|nr:hypothetical protein, conserved [Eimeria brunetti]
MKIQAPTSEELKDDKDWGLGRCGSVFKARGPAHMAYIGCTYYAILMNWGVVFSVCVVLWYVNRLLNTKRAEWRLLFFSLACVLLPRAALPFRFVDCTMQQMCLMGIAFFNGRLSCKAYMFCGATLVVLTISDLAWGVLNPRLLVLKSVGASLAVVIGILGFRIVQTQAAGRMAGCALEPPVPVRQRRPYLRGDPLDDCSDTAIWREEGEQQFFVVPSSYYGYVDCNWYLDMRLARAVGGILCFPSFSGMEEPQAVMPKVKLGVFEDSAVERWYLLWRAEHIVAFYKDTCHINLLICALQCLFTVGRLYFVECLFTAVEKYDDGDSNSLECSDALQQDHSSRRIMATLWRPLLQFLILSALILPMKFMGSRRGKNGWKFQLLAVGQAVTYTVFVFFELLERCLSQIPAPFNKEASRSPKGTILGLMLGGQLFFPLFSIALTVHLRRIPEAVILIISVGSALVTSVTLSAKGWEIRVVGFYTLSRSVYASFAIMLVRAFEKVRRQLFATQALPFLMYLSTLANSQRVGSACTLKAEQCHCGYQHAQPFLKAPVW